MNGRTKNLVKTKLMEEAGIGAIRSVSANCRIVFNKKVLGEIVDELICFSIKPIVKSSFGRRNVKNHYQRKLFYEIIWFIL